MCSKLYILITLCIGCFFYGQNIIVKDSLTLIPLDNVKIQSYTEDVHYATTNHLGHASLPKNATDSLRVSLNDYTQRLIIKNDLNSEQDNIILLKNESFKLNNIVVTGTNWKYRAKKHTAHTITLTEKDIKNLNQPTTADLLAKTNEVFIQKSQLGGGSPMIRGFATNRLLIAVDGVNMNNAIFRSGNIQNIIAIDPYTISKVDVLTGPSSVMFGSDAIGGVLSFETEAISTSEKLDINGDVSLRYATAANERTAHLGLNYSNKKWAAYSSVSYTSYDDAKMGNHGPEEYLRYQYVDQLNGSDVIVDNKDPLIQKFSGYDQINFLQKYLYKFHDNFNLTASFNFSRTGNVPRYDRLLRRRDNILKSAEWYYGPQEWILSILKSDYSKNTLLFDHWESTLSHQYFTESRHDRDFGSDWKRNRYERVNLWAWENNFLKKLDRQNKIFYGFDARFNHINSSSYQENINTLEKDLIASRYPDGSTWDQYGIYAKFITEVSNSINLDAGIRYSYIDSKSSISNEFYNFPFDNADLSAQAITGSLGLIYKPTAKLRFNTQIATGFRAPNIDDIAKVFDSEPGNVIVPNPNLKPEYVYNVEAGISYALGNDLYINALAYYSWLEDALVRRNYTINGESTIVYDDEVSQIQALQNASQARVFGGLFQLEYNLFKSSKLMGKLNYVNGKEQSDDGINSPMRHASPLMANLTYETTINKLKLTLDYDFNAQVDADAMPLSEKNKEYLYALDEYGNPYVPEIHVFYFTAQIHLNDYITTQLRVDNIFDRRYRPFASGISALGRNFVLSIRTIF